MTSDLDLSLPYLVRIVIVPTRFKGRGNNPYPSMGGLSEFAGTVFGFLFFDFSIYFLSADSFETTKVLKFIG